MKSFVCCVVLGWVVAGCVIAQESEEPRRRIALPGHPEPEEKVGPEEEKFMLAYSDSALEESILPLLEELSGMRVVAHESIRRKEVTVRTVDPVGPTEAVGVIETSLAAQGIVVVEQGEKTLLLLPADSKVGKLDFAPPVVANRVDLRESQRIVDFVLKSETMDAEKLAAFFKDRTKLLPIGRIDAGPDGKSLVIRERAAVIRRMLELVDAME